MNLRWELVEAESQSNNKLSSDFKSQVWSDGRVVYPDSAARQECRDEQQSLYLPGEH